MVAKAEDSATPPPIDVRALLRRCQGKAPLAERLLLKLEQQLDIQIEAMRQSLAAQDQAELSRIAHTLKGSAANLSAEPLRAAAGELERLGHEAAFDAAASCLEQLAAEASRYVQSIPRAVEELAVAARS
jgi:HPt (histidine-containing phosphotransfer) domain-containing protein